MDTAYRNCMLCPRACGIDRTQGSLGFCGQTDKLYAAKAYLHLWEEPCLCGQNGSGTIFFCGCNLKCIYCQNYAISRENDNGIEITADRLCEIYFELYEKGAANINLVTPTHFLPHIIRSIQAAKQKGFTLPFVYNTSGYENAKVLKQLEGLIDIYLADIKYYANAYARRYSHANDYFKHAFSALQEMFRQRGALRFDSENQLQSGVIVRHLVLPDMVTDSKRILSALFPVFRNDILYSIMRQYTPVQIPSDYAEIDRAITKAEYAAVVDHARALGIESAYIQQDKACDESFIPCFDGAGIVK